LFVTVEQMIKRDHGRQEGGESEEYRPIVDHAPPRGRRPRPSASVIAFPPARRYAFIRRHAARMAQMPAQRAESYLRQQLRIQAETAQRRGISAREVKHLVMVLESETRAHMRPHCNTRLYELLAAGGRSRSSPSTPVHLAPAGSITPIENERGVIRDMTAEIIGNALVRSAVAA
jgi:Family of unknown function (DUF6074)